MIRYFALIRGKIFAYRENLRLTAIYETAEKSKRRVVLTVNGKDAAVVQDAEAYQHLLDIAAHGDAEEGIRQGLENVKEGKLQPARQFFNEFDAANGISR
jgi:PHD/YefM family antitoxin component YafN of YafNO toxin-antitoxin module